MDNRHSQKLSVLRILILITLGFIWGNSLLNGKQSGEMSGLAVRIVYPAAEMIAEKLTGTDPGEGPVLSMAQVTFWVRKAAHFTEYLLLGVEMGLYSKWLKKTPDVRSIFIKNPVVLCFGPLTAVIDESIQLFSEGRSGQIRDVLIDTSGYLLGLLLLLALYKYIALYFRKSRKED